METKPKIELRNIKHSAFASQETYCYQASLFVDGTKLGQVGNDGHGGCDYFYPAHGFTDAHYLALNKRIKATYPPITFDQGTLEPDLELVCGEMVSDWLREKDFKRAMKAKVLFTKPGIEGVWEINVKKPSTFAATLDAIKTKQPTFTYLADLPADQAKAIYFAL